MPKKTIILAVLLAAFAFGLYLVKKTETADKNSQTELRPEQSQTEQFKSKVAVKGKVFETEIADTAEKRNRGLSGRTSMAENQAMLFVFEKHGQYGFWMKGMNFSLDIIWISNNKIVGIAKNLPYPKSETEQPSTAMPASAINMALEINAGLSDKYGFEIGDSVEISNYPN